MYTFIIVVLLVFKIRMPRSKYGKRELTGEDDSELILTILNDEGKRIDIDSKFLLLFLL